MLRMSDKHSRLAVPVAVVLGCLTLFLVVLGLIAVTDNDDVNPAIGFPIVLAVLAVVVLVTAVIWRVVSQRKHSSRR